MILLLASIPHRRSFLTHLCRHQKPSSDSADTRVRAHSFLDMKERGASCFDHHSHASLSLSPVSLSLCSIFRLSATSKLPERSRVCKSRETSTRHVFSPLTAQSDFREECGEERGVCVRVRRNWSHSLALMSSSLNSIVDICAPPTLALCSALLLSYPHLLTLTRVVTHLNSRGKQKTPQYFADGCFWSRCSHIGATVIWHLCSLWMAATIAGTVRCHVIEFIYIWWYLKNQKSCFCFGWTRNYKRLWECSYERGENVMHPVTSGKVG